MAFRLIPEATQIKNALKVRWFVFIGLIIRKWLISSPWECFYNHGYLFEAVKVEEFCIECVSNYKCLKLFNFSAQMGI